MYKIFVITVLINFLNTDAFFISPREIQRIFGIGPPPPPYEIYRNAASDENRIKQSGNYAKNIQDNLKQTEREPSNYKKKNPRDEEHRQHYHESPTQNNERPHNYQQNIEPEEQYNTQKEVIYNNSGNEGNEPHQQEYQSGNYYDFYNSEYSNKNEQYSDYNKNQNFKKRPEDCIHYERYSENRKKYDKESIGSQINKKLVTNQEDNNYVAGILLAIPKDTKALEKILIMANNSEKDKMEKLIDKREGGFFQDLLKIFQEDDN